MNRRRSTSIAGSPLLIGAVTTLIAIVAVFLSYNANNGLPFTPTYDIKIALPQAAGLQPGNQVRVGGTRVGVISSMEPHQDPATGRVTAIAHLKLEKSIQPLPTDTTATPRLVTAIGLKYLELERGHSAVGLKAGATIPASQTHETVEIDQLFNMFDKKTRTAIKQNQTSIGSGLAGRGIGLNETIHTLRPLARNAIPVLRNLASPQTGLREFFVALDRAASEVAPVARQQAGLYSDLDTFFAAWASVASSLERAIEGGPPALRQATRSLPFEAPFVNKSAEFMRLLRPGAQALRTTAGPLGHAFGVGAVNLRKAVALNDRIAEASQAFAAFARDPIVENGLEDITHTLSLGNPAIAGLASEQTSCNYITLAFRNLSSLLSESIGVGTLARVAPILAATGPGDQGLPAAAPATTLTGEVNGKNANLHANPYPNVGGPGHACEAGNEPYLAERAVIGNVPGARATHEVTRREQNLFGETYPRHTLADLGLLRPAKPKKPSAKGKRK